MGNASGPGTKKILLRSFKLEIAFGKFQTMQCLEYRNRTGNK